MNQWSTNNSTPLNQSLLMMNDNSMNGSHSDNKSIISQQQQSLNIMAANHSITQSTTPPSSFVNNNNGSVKMNGINDNESILSGFTVDNHNHLNPHNKLNGNATATYASLLTTTAAAQSAASATINQQSTSSTLLSQQHSLSPQSLIVGTSAPTTTSSTLCRPQQSSTTNVILNPYHGNYQSVNVSQENRICHNSVVSLRSNGRQSNRNAGGQITMNNNKKTTIESIYPISNNHHQNVPISIMSPDDWNDNTTAITGNTSDQSGGSLDDLSKIDTSSNYTNQRHSRQSSQPQPIYQKYHIFKHYQIWSSTIIPTLLIFSAFISPILMIVIPRIEYFELKTKECGQECDGPILSLLFKLLILMIGSYLIFFRQPTYRMPRICTYRCIILILILLLLISYWLFYVVRILDKRNLLYPNDEQDLISYSSIISFSASLIDVLLFIHYLSLILIHCCHLETEFFVKVVRSPDGHSECYTIGRTSIQRCSLWIIRKYYQDFPKYNPFFDHLALKNRKNRNNKLNNGSIGKHGLKFYDVDGVNSGCNDVGKINANDPLQLSPKSILAQNTAANAGGSSKWLAMKKNSLNGGGGGVGVGDTSSTIISDNHSVNRKRHNNNDTSHSRNHYRSILHEEHEYERRIRKRKSRLINVTEEAFAHIKRIQEHQQNGQLSASSTSSMNAKEAAQAIFPTIARTLQKYLRATRQQTQHSVQSILEHLTICLQYDLSSKTFLEKYLSPNNLHLNWTIKDVGHMNSNNSSISNNDQRTVETWNLIADTLVSRSIENNTQFLLRQDYNHHYNNVCLLVTITSMPFINLNEQFIDLDKIKFLFKLNSETSV